jgi:hypothetical protein
MKTLNKLKMIMIMLMGVLFFPSASSGQCSTDDYLDNCASALGSYNYIKSFIVDVKARKKNGSEYSYVFSKGSKYMLIACDQNVIGGKMIMNLYDRNHTLVACTYDEKDKKYYSDLVYPCSSTGVYYITFTFPEAKKGCGLCIIGFNKE